jgi:hypothetical protein
VSDFHDTPTTPKARKEHTCIACLRPIPKGEVYTQQKGFYESKPYTNRYHDECWATLSREGDFDFIPGDVEPPARLFKIVEVLS